MAPVTASNVGMTPQLVDSPKLQDLQKTLNEFSLSVDGETTFSRILALVQELKPYESWSFQEQVDLYDWIPALNTIDASLTYLVKEYPTLLLVAPVARKHATPLEKDAPLPYARNMQDVCEVPQQVTDALASLLRFTSCLLRNSISKNVYNSVLELADLLGAANDTIASLALECLSSLAIAPAMHKQQAPEMHHHSTVLHNKTTSSMVHARLLALAKGWGTRGSGLGLAACVSADDSEYGQGALPTNMAGQVQFEYYTTGQEEKCIQLSTQDLLVPDNDDDNNDDDESEQSNKKRRIMSCTTNTSAVRERTRSTAELFFASVQQAGGRDKIPDNRLFLLLADVRLAKGFYSQASRIACVKNRLHALLAILQAHSSPEIMSGYFTAQPELVMELMDLLRPTVSSSAVSAAAAASSNDGSDDSLQSISALANSPQVPYEIRTLALEALTCLVSRRDGASGGLTGVARQSNVLQELGVGKGMYLGLLPTLIRYSLASLTSFLAMKDETKEKQNDGTDDDVAMDIGLAFVKASQAEPLPLGVQLNRALEFVDAVLTLTSSVVSAPTGTAALTDCGLVPALLSMVAMDGKSTPSILSESSSVLSQEERSNAKSLLRFITAQSIQIVDQAAVTHTNALSAFHDLNGVQVLTSRLSVEMEAIRNASSQMEEKEEPVAANGDEKMEDAVESTPKKNLRTIDSSQRVLLFSIANCLTAVFHQESGTATTSPMGGVQLRKPELTDSVREVMQHVESYGGVLVALILSLLSDVMNSDPQVVHHVHSSGIADAVLDMFDESSLQTIPPVAELIMGLPSVLSAISLTEDGATAVLKKNPFPGLLRIFYSPEYSMPKNRCMLNEMTAIVGTGLDEIMRHVPRHRPLVMTAIVGAMEQVVSLGSKLVGQEEAMDLSFPNDEALQASLEKDRTCLMQYATNFGQMLEQILHNEEHCEPFVRAGGLDAILSLFPYLMPSGLRFLANASCLSCPSICTLAHSTTEDLLAMAFKCIAMHYNSGNLVTKMMGALESHLESLERIQGEMLDAFSGMAVEGEPSLNADCILENLPCLPLHHALESEDFVRKAACLSNYLRAVVTLQWLTNLFGGVIRAGCQRSQQSGSSWGRHEFKWKKEAFTSPRFKTVMTKVAGFCQSANLEVCRIRTEEDFEARNTLRLKKEEVGSSGVRYRLRIVCQEGALVRDGIEIDSCASVGSMEMGETTVAYDRCVNSSGVMRYRTSRGWVSELTRGHGREPIAEVLNVWNSKDEGSPLLHIADKTKKQFNCGVTDLRAVGASILARLQGSYCELFSSLSRELVQSFRAVPPRSVSFETNTVGGYVRGLLEVMSSNIRQGINNETVTNAMASPPTSSSTNVAVTDSGISMYLGSQIAHLQSCIFDDNRERRNVNVPLLLRLLYSDEGDSPTLTPCRPFFLDAIGFMFRQSLSELQDQRKGGDATDDIPRQGLSRTIAASLPPAVTLMEKLIPSSLLSSSTLTSVLSRMNDTDRYVLLADGGLDEVRQSDKKLSYRPEYLTKGIQCAVAETLLEVWRDPRFVCAPAQIIYPVASVSKGAIASLQEKPSTESSESNGSDGRNQWGVFPWNARRRLPGERNGDDGSGENDDTAAQESFEPSEEIISHLTDMGFSREHALDALESTRTNRLDVAMEYVLSISSLSQDELATRRAGREERARAAGGGQTSASTNQNEASDEGLAASNGTSGNGNDSQESGLPDASVAENGSNNEVPNGNDGMKDDDAKKATEITPDELMARRVDECCRSWSESASNVAIRVMSGVCDGTTVEVAESLMNTIRLDNGEGNGDAEAEAVTVTLSSFLLDLCQQYPENRDKVISELLDRLVSLFSKVENDGKDSWVVPTESSGSFASLCHAIVLCTRGLPNSRILVLQKGVVRRLVSSIKAYSHSCLQSKDGESQPSPWPIWLSPGLLLLDVMAQPVVASTVDFASARDADEELSVVCEERKQKAAGIAQTADAIFSTIQQLDAKSENVESHDSKDDPPTETNAEASSRQDEAETKDSSPAADVEMGNKDNLQPFSNVPPYFPLLTDESAETCLLVCLDLLGKDKADSKKSPPPPPGVVQAVLSLLMRLVRSPKMASRCLELGATELILSLPRECRFTGNAGLATIILRRLLEDEATLQSSMASEIRYAITKLAGVKGSKESSERPTAPTHSFVQAVTPLICRDPVSFLTAVATTVSVESKDGTGTSTNRDSAVVLLTPEQSARNSRALVDVLNAKDTPAQPTSERRGSRASDGGKAQRRRSGSRSSSKRSSSVKRNRKEKGDQSNKKNGNRVGTVTGTPANHIMCQLIAKVVLLASSDSEALDGRVYGESSSFLWLADVLEVMASLVLAVPACAAAIHRYRGSSSNSATPSLEVPHALSGCPSPPRTFVNFLLHSVLPQDRWTFKPEQLLDATSDVNKEETKIRKKLAHMNTRVAQTSARLLVSLVARAGEGRRRVIADLTFALSGGHLGHSSPNRLASAAMSMNPDDMEFHALQAWGDLCIGLAAPRSGGPGNESSVTLSFEVVKLMLDFGMAHAVMYGLHRIQLQHPMAASTCSSLLVPLEVFTRRSVTDSVEALAEKESAAVAKRKETGGDSKPPGAKPIAEATSSVSAGPSQRNEASFADDAMLEDGFDADTAARAVRRQQGMDFDEDGDENMDDALGEYINEESNESNDDEMQVEEAGDIDEDADSEDEEMSSDNSSGVTEGIDDDDQSSDSDSEDDEEASIDSQEDSIDENFDDEVQEEEEEARDWELNDDFLEGPAEEERQDEGGGGMNELQLDMDEGWTRIEANGFGGMLLGGRRPPRALGAPNLPAASRARGFIDAAEAMIGTLLRNGDLDGNALSEIEGTLGIRIVRRENPDSGDPIEENPLFAGVMGRANRERIQPERPPRPVAAGAIGSIPLVHQRSPPGFTTMGGTGRWNEISAMEYIYGGSCLSSGSRNYDLSRNGPVDDPDSDSYHTPATVDMRLFPGGPATATHSRTEPPLHPLLCGIDLPPINALVSDLVPSGTRAVRRSQTNLRPSNSAARPLPGGGFLVSTQGGNIVRVNRAPGGGGNSDVSRAVASHGLHGWTDDGLPFDDTVASFSSAVQRAFVASMAPPPPPPPPPNDENVTAQEPSVAERPADETAASSGVPRSQVEGAVEPPPDDRLSRSNDAGGTGTEETGSVSSEHGDARPSDAPEIGPVSGDSARGNSIAIEHANRESPQNDGDGVASSLAAGLRLSPADEETASSDQAMAAESQLLAESTNGGEVAPGEAETNPPVAEDVAANMQDDETEQEEPQVEAPAAMEEEQESVAPVQPQVENSVEEVAAVQDHQEGNALACPPGMDQEVFNSLPVEMQREVVEQNQVAADVAGQLDAASGLDPEALAALPEEMRREVIEQDQRERREREQAPADPSNAEEMDSASFIASLAPELREEILLTADEGFLNSLPPNIIAEANILRERASAVHRRANEGGTSAAGANRSGQRTTGTNTRNVGAGAGGTRKKQRPGKTRLDTDRSQILYLPSGDTQLSPLPGVSDMKVLLRLLYLRAPILPQRLLQKVFHNICSQKSLRNSLSTAFVQLLNDNGPGAVAALQAISNEYSGDQDWRKKMDVEFSDDSGNFPPTLLIGAPPEVVDADQFNPSLTLFRRRQTNNTVDSVAACLPSSARGSNEDSLPPAVATTIVDTLLSLSKVSPRICIDALQNELVGSKLHETADRSLIFDKLLDLLDKPRYSRSATNLEQLLNLIDAMVSPLSFHPRIGEEEHAISQRDLDAAAAAGKEYVDIPRIVVSQSRLQLLCSILRMESCRDAAFTKVNSIARRLCRVEENRGYILGELGAVAQSLATDAIRDLRTLNIRMQDAAVQQQNEKANVSEMNESGADESKDGTAGGSASSSVTLSISSSELKLLRVLQTLQSLCVDTSDESTLKKDGKIVVTDQLVKIFESMKLDDLWKHLDSCLNAVKVLEGVTTVEEIDEKNGGDDDASNDGPGEKKLQNSVAGLLTRFLPIIEAFFVVNASSRSSRSIKASKEKKDDEESNATSAAGGTEDADAEAPAESTMAVDPQAQATVPAAKSDEVLDALVDGKLLVEFVESNRVLLNALVRNNPTLLEKALRSLMQVPQCRAMLDFDVKRHWFKAQVRRLRQHASRRHGSLRLGIRRKYVFEDAYHQLRLRNADEMRGRLHITFRNEEGVDAGGLSREFFGILGKEIFNPNYALFTSTEDGCTFQPNRNSSINPDHLSYFRFVGRIVGKAVADGFLLDAHFTRSLYKHMLGQKPTVGDMEAIDPDYYKNLQTILEHNLDDIGLELTFSAEDFSFGRRDIIDLIPNGRNIAVTEENKEKYVSLVCEHRMTTAISSQIKAYLDGFYEMVNRDLIAIFTPRELELLISGLPDIDVHDLRQNTEYQGYRATDKEIQWFWNVMFSLSRSEKAAFLQFVTGSSKVPLAGFSELQGMRGVQKFSIHKAGGSSGALMSAHTCFNSLDLPVYKSEEETRQKLLYAISEGGGAFMFA